LTLAFRIALREKEREKEKIPMANLARKQETAYTLEQLAADVEALVAREREHARIVAAAEPLLTRFLAASTLPEEYCRPAAGRVATEHQDFTVYRLHRGPRDCFNIMVAIWPAGGTSGVHDHAGKWVVEGVYRNKLHTVRYKRLDDGSRPGYAELRETVALNLDPGDVAHVLSPNQEIHDFINATDKPVVSVHIYGGDISTETLNYFDPAAKTVTQVTHEIRYDNE
jgi:predicted metal-dependent enzyme (double-stranded beta helix superfamily)